MSATGTMGWVISSQPRCMHPGATYLPVQETDDTTYFEWLCYDCWQQQVLLRALAC